MKSSSSDSLQKSFKSNDLSSDDEKADRQVRQTHENWELKKNVRMLDLLEEDDDVQEAG